jgi:hypothetical protein
MSSAATRIHDAYARIPMNSNSAPNPIQRSRSVIGANGSRRSASKTSVNTGTR